MLGSMPNVAIPTSTFVTVLSSTITVLYGTKTQMPYPNTWLLDTVLFLI